MTIKRGITFFPKGTTEQQVADWIDECIPELIRRWKIDGGVPMTKTYKIKIPSIGKDVFIGITTRSDYEPWKGTNHFIIGQFYPDHWGVRVEKNYLKYVSSLL